MFIRRFGGYATLLLALASSFLLYVFASEVSCSSSPTQSPSRSSWHTTSSCEVPPATIPSEDIKDVTSMLQVKMASELQLGPKSDKKHHHGRGDQQEGHRHRHVHRHEASKRRKKVEGGKDSPWVKDTPKRSEASKHVHTSSSSASSDRQEEESLLGSEKGRHRAVGSATQSAESSDWKELAEADPSPKDKHGTKEAKQHGKEDEDKENKDHEDKKDGKKHGKHDKNDKHEDHEEKKDGKKDGEHDKNDNHEEPKSTTPASPSSSATTSSQEPESTTTTSPLSSTTTSSQAKDRDDGEGKDHHDREVPPANFSGMKMSVDSLAADVRHRDDETFSEDWGHEYPLDRNFVQANADTRLMSYWDDGSCGPGDDDDQNWSWCTTLLGGAPNCYKKVDVSTNICASGEAVLAEVKGTGKMGSISIKGCNYAFFAQYKCKDEEGGATPETSTTSVAEKVHRKSAEVETTTAEPETTTTSTVASTEGATTTSKKAERNHLEGTWDTAERHGRTMQHVIEDGKLKWQSGRVTKLHFKGKDKLVMEYNKTKYTAEANGDKLQWSDGDTWTRVPASLAKEDHDNGVSWYHYFTTRPTATLVLFSFVTAVSMIIMLALCCSPS